MRMQQAAPAKCSCERSGRSCRRCESTNGSFASPDRDLSTSGSSVSLKVTEPRFQHDFGAIRVQDEGAGSTPQLARIRERLSGLYVSDDDAHEVLVILASLDQEELRDTIEAMEKEKLAARLLDDNISSEDQVAYAAIIEALQNVPAVGTTCKKEQREVVDKSIDRAKSAIAEAFFDLLKYIGNPESKTQLPIQAALDTHFHTHDPQDAKKVRNSLLWMAGGLSSASLWYDCTNEPICEGAQAFAQADKPGFKLCPNFFSARTDDDSRTETIIHETSHIWSVPGKRAGAHDYAYSSQRLYPLLASEEALQNADSFSGFVMQIWAKTSPGASAGASTPPKDVFQKACNQKSPLIQSAVARAERINALAAIRAAEKGDAYVITPRPPAIS